MEPASGRIELSVSDFVALHNQLLEYAVPTVTIIGELANFRVAKNRWVYFDLKDETASVKFFATVYQLTGPLEDGMLLRVHGTPRVHPQFGFSITTLSIEPVGEGTIKRASDLLQRQLAAEGLFDPARKRPVPYPPATIGVITSKESAAYADFVKVLGARWSGLDITLADVQVQGEAAPGQITAAISAFNQLAEPPEVLVLIRGGGSADDLWAFSSEPVTRAVAASRIPTLVAIGHEIDLSLAELAADMRASTPSNAAELLVPDRRAEQIALAETRRSLVQLLGSRVARSQDDLRATKRQLKQSSLYVLERSRDSLIAADRLLTALNPHSILGRGYAIIRDDEGQVVRSKSRASTQPRLAVEFADGTIHVMTKEAKRAS